MTSTHDAGAPQREPESEKATGTNSGLSKQHDSQQNPDVSAVASYDKDELTAAALCALQSITFRKSQDDAGRQVYIVSHDAWGLCRALPDLPAVHAWLRMIGGRRG